MKRKTIIGALVLFAGAAYAQPTPFRVPPKYTVATAPSCVNGEPKLYAVTDAASSASCAVAGGTTEVICQCLDGVASVVGSGSGSSSNSFETINAPAGTDPVADSATDTLNVTCAGGLTCTGTAATDTLDFTMGTASLATALAANGANCSAGNYPLGVDASGAAESCTADGPSTYAASVSAGGPATTATALAADPADCAANQYANAIAASGALTCAAIADADVPDTITASSYAALTGADFTGAVTANWTDGTATSTLSVNGSGINMESNDGVLYAASISVSASNGTTIYGIAGCLEIEGLKWCAASSSPPYDCPGTSSLGYYTDTDDSNLYYCNATAWAAIGSGDVVGPASSTDNAIARYDSTTGKLLQNSALTVSDVAASVVTLATTAGNGLTVDVTEPTATTGASVAGKATLMSAGNAVASTDTDGAAGGGDFTIYGGEAARRTSGDAAGGNIILRPGTHVGGGGTGRSGQVRVTAPTGGLSSQWPLMTIAGGTYPTLQLSSWYMGSPGFRGEHFTISEDVAGGGYEFFIDGLLNGVSMRRIVSASTAGSGAPQGVGAANLGFPFFGIATNEGATAKVYFTLTTAAAGYEQTFIVQDADGLRITSSASDTIQVIDKVTAAAGYIESTTIGSTVTLVSVNAVEWYATEIHGVWTDGTWTYDDTGLTSP